MKKYLVPFLLLCLSSSLFAQSPSQRTLSKCRYIYVWDFLDQDKNKNRTTNDITESVEEALTNIDECFVLQRRNLATLVNHAAAEKGTNSVKDMRTEITHALAGKGAKQVLFGVVDMSARDACEVRLRVEDLTTSRIVTAKSTRILYSEIANIDQRNKVIYKLVCQLVGILYIESQSKPDKIPTVDQPKNYTNVSKAKFTLSAKSGFDLIMGNCTGDAYNQTVTVNFTFINNNPNLTFSFPSGIAKSFANDDDGNQYPYIATSLGGETREKFAMRIEKEFFTGTKLRASITFGNVLPGVKKLSLVKVPFSKQLSGTYNTSYAELAIRDLEINWR